MIPWSDHAAEPDFGGSGACAHVAGPDRVAELGIRPAEYDIRVAGPDGPGVGSDSASSSSELYEVAAVWSAAVSRWCAV